MKIVHKVLWKQGKLITAMTLYFGQLFMRDGASEVKVALCMYTENLLEIFDIMAALNATRLNVRDIKENLWPRLIEALVRRSGLLPPTESMLTLHELVHICDQVDEVGVPRVSS